MIKILRIMMKSASVVLSIMILVLIPSVVSAETPIIIDGYYDDWADKPHTSVSDNSGNTHSVALFLDSSYLYGHIKMSNTSGHFYPNNTMNLVINNQYPISFEIDKYQIRKLDVNNLPVGITLNLATFYLSGKKIIWFGNSAVTVTNINHSIGDDVEFSIDLATARRLCNNIAIDQMQTFTLSCPSLGSQTITITGTSTYPFIGIIVTISVVSLIVLFRKKRHTVK